MRPPSAGPRRRCPQRDLPGRARGAPRRAAVGRRCRPRPGAAPRSAQPHRPPSRGTAPGPAARRCCGAPATHCRLRSTPPCLIGSYAWWVQGCRFRGAILASAEQTCWLKGSFWNVRAASVRRIPSSTWESHLGCRMASRSPSTQAGADGTSALARLVATTRSKMNAAHSAWTRGRVGHLIYHTQEQLDPARPDKGSGYVRAQVAQRLQSSNTILAADFSSEAPCYIFRGYAVEGEPNGPLGEYRTWVACSGQALRTCKRTDKV